MQPLEPRRESRLLIPSESGGVPPSGLVFHKSRITGAAPLSPSSISPHQQTTFVRDILTSLLLFLLVSEWLHPLAWMADASLATGPVLVVFAICIAIDCFKVPYAWGWSAKAALILLFIGFMFNRESFMSGAWVLDVVRAFAQDAGHLTQGRFELVSGELRTLFFLLGWSLLISVIQVLMLQRQHSLWFVGATLIYLVVLQLVLGADTAHGIIRTLGYGLLLLALLNLARIEQTYGFAPVRPGRSVQWMAATAALVGLLAGAAWYSAKEADPQPLMKPVSWDYLSDRLFELYNEDYASGGGAVAGAAKSGYGNNDTALGGPLQVDTTPAFTAKTSELTYWRGESKNFYDGKGWTQTNQALEPFVLPLSNPSGSTVTQEVLWNDKSPNKQLFAGGNLIGVDTLLTDKGKPLSPSQLLGSPFTGKLTLPEIADPLSYYKITVQPVKEDPALLNADRGGYPEEIARDYLQLPDALPRSVRSLAEQVTANRATPYAKAVAVEQYLSHTYTYSLEKPTRPSRSEDFVSHFLFVDKTGYCDHFSTAMVVMLRSVGVPARWVKGFAPGTLQADDGGIEPLQEVLVRNQDAHSWVEVYFPSMGWVPFEPTPGFSGISSDHPRETLTTAAMEQSAMTASLMNVPLPGGFAGHTGEWLQAAKDKALDYARANRNLMIILAGITAMAAGVLLYLKRKGFMARTALVPFYRDRNAHPLVPYMDRLWLQLFRKHGAKPKDQTVRDYVTGLNLRQHAQKQALLQFALMYESIRYDTAGSAPYTKREIAAIWKAIQKTH
ncbi:transglutaminase family protein [Paenibacillus sp. GCM10023248]|uniref:transglutaminase-like domain-containing protein n=1 Tax=unclassified Paenibacillus TaxID=185978 RepID=UPI002379600C|nr:transglutaminase domain-containing protein [Paenibacillus sp. MAHUQ-63]MDD9271143.1 transglutaminase domain-containing protein [Paenibacillus sp. MAHUQ-63]